MIRRLTVCVTGVWAGVDSIWEQVKLEARKIRENAAESPTLGKALPGALRLELCDAWTSKFSWD
jgi:hypothetical protein